MNGCTAEIVASDSRVIFCSNVCRVAYRNWRYRAWWKRVGQRKALERRESKKGKAFHLPIISAEGRRLRAENPLPASIDECRGGPRPCPLVTCPYHLYLDVSKGGQLNVHFPDKEVWELEESCAIDVAERGEHRPHALATFYNVSYQGVRQKVEAAMARLEKLAPDIALGLRELLENATSARDACKHPLVHARDFAPGHDLERILQQIKKRYVDLGLDTWRLHQRVTPQRDRKVKKS